ncbi:uncharacterized protein LOC143021466 [Oratosquilla oratoria]|uniref:uncharacterized protein LOC143021466 n=1 Tax=Oratosquilla oratoria TaxID=337810 RepID=UPI003F769CCF
MNTLAAVMLIAVVSAQPQLPAVRLARPGSFNGVELQQTFSSFQQGVNNQNNQFQDGFSSNSQFQTTSDISGSQVTSFGEGSSKLTPQVLSSQSEFPVDGVFEPLNLPSGASILMRQIDTSFQCADRPYGYYADEGNNCQVFHVCNPYLFDDGRIDTVQHSFMCNEGLRFDQKELTCVDQFAALPCPESSFFYSRNEEFGRPEEKNF